ncbi:MAG: glycosyltransferase, partial [Elusimicrobia bacterium]|nr:glycosyltransferase [Elusimicrobiota bacterium]
MAPRVSVLINNHNYGRFLGEAIDSVLAQGLPEPELEVVVVDDGSTDDSREVVASYGGRVRGVFQPRSGQTSAVNRGFAESKGAFVFLLDSDDVWLPGKLAKVLPLFDDPKVGAVQHFLQDADARLRPFPRRFPKWPARYALEDLIAGRTELTAVSGLGFRRAALAQALPLPTEMFFYLDDWMVARTLLDWEVANIPEALALRRIHGANWYADNYHDARKIEGDLKHRAIYRRALDRWLAERGLRLSAAALDAERLELFRRRVLLAALRADPRGAVAAWSEGLAGLPAGAHARFRAATVLLAALSPSL